MAIENTLNEFKKAASGAMDKGKDKYREMMDEIEGWARENTADSKEKLLAKAREHGLEVNDKMDIGEIKNKIKTKLRDKFR